MVTRFCYRLKNEPYTNLQTQFNQMRPVRGESERWSPSMQPRPNLVHLSKDRGRTSDGLSREGVTPGLLRRSASSAAEVVR